MTKARDLANFVSGTNSAITTTQIDDDAVTNAKIANESITINGSAVNLGGSVTVGETKPTFSSISPSTIENTQTSVTISGGNFVTVPLVTAIHSTTGALIVADEVSFTNASTIVAKFTISVDGTYKLYIENPDGMAVQSGAVLTVSDAPAWTTSAGSLGTFAAGSSFGTINLTATDSTSMAKTSGTFPGGMTLNSGGSGTSTLTGTESGATSETTYSFTIRATDAQGQTADRAFSITITVGINNSGQFN
jgi:filamentous hemagglutinin family protein